MIGMIARKNSYRPYMAGLAVAGLIAVSLAMGQGLGTSATPANSTESTLIGVTMPSQPGKTGEQGQLHALLPGIVKELKVKDGDTVKAGQVLIQLDDRMEQAALRSAKVQAESTAALEAAEADLAQKRVELKNQQQMLALKVAQPIEVERAEVDVKVGEARVKVAKEEILQKKADMEKAITQVEYMQIKSPIDGVVNLEIGPGQRADQDRAVCTVIRNDPLWVRVNIKAKDALGLTVDDVLRVKYEDDKDWYDAKVIFLNPRVDAASGKREVRLEMPNKGNKPSGLEVQVMLPTKVAGK